MSGGNQESPISAGWRGHLNGHVSKTPGSQVKVTEITLQLDPEVAWALCNLLTDSCLSEEVNSVSPKQKEMLANVGAAIGRLIDHPSANNGNRDVVKP